MTYGLDFHRAKNRLYRKKIGTGSGQEPPAAAISGRSSEVRPGMFVKRFLVGAAASTSRRLSSSSSPYPTLAAPFGVDHRGSEDQPEFKPEKVLLLTKVTRYEFERNRFPGCSEETLREKMEKRGSNHDLIRQHHEVHKQVLKKLIFPTFFNIQQFSSELLKLTGYVTIYILLIIFLAQIVVSLSSLSLALT